MTSSKPAIKKWQLILITATIAVVLPLALSAFQRDPELAKRATEVEAMTELDRRQLEKQFRDFQALTPSQQDHYRQLHAQLNGDRAELQTSLHDYREFLRSLNLVDRAEIEVATSTTEKLAAVRKLVAEREQRQAQLEEAFSTVERARTQFERQFRLALGPDDFQSLGTVLETQLPPDALRRVNLMNLPPEDHVTRFAVLLEATLRPRMNVAASSSDAPLFDQQTLQELLAAIKTEEVRKFIESTPDPRDRISHLLRFSFWSCFRETMKQAPTSQQMHELLEPLAPQERTRYLELPPAEMHAQLVREYFRTHPTPLSSAVYEMKSLVDALSSRQRGRGPSRPGERTGERPDGERPGERPRGEPNREPGREPPPSGERPQRPNGERRTGFERPDGERRPPNQNPPGEPTREDLDRSRDERQPE